MKIIGTTANDGLLLSATRDEVANLVGYYASCCAPTAIQNTIKPGMEITVSKMFNTLYEMARQKKELAECAAQLRVCADTIELTSPVIENTQHENVQP